MLSMLFSTFLTGFFMGLMRLTGETYNRILYYTTLFLLWAISKQKAGIYRHDAIILCLETASVSLSPHQRE